MSFVTDFNIVTVFISFGGLAFFCLLFFRWQQASLLRPARAIERRRVLLIFAGFGLLFAAVAAGLVIKGTWTSEIEVQPEIWLDDSHSTELELATMQKWPAVLGQELTSRLGESVAVSRLSGKSIDETKKTGTALGKRSPNRYHFNIAVSDCRETTTKADVWVCPETESSGNFGITSIRFDSSEVFGGKKTGITFRVFRSLKKPGKISGTFAGKEYTWNLPAKVGSHDYRFLVTPTGKGQKKYRFKLATNIPGNRPGDDEVSGYVFVRPARYNFSVVSSQPGYDLSLWAKIAGDNPKLKLKKKISVSKNDVVNCKGISGLSLVHNIKGSAGCKQGGVYVFSAGNVKALVQLFPDLKVGVPAQGSSKDLLQIVGSDVALPIAIQNEVIKLADVLSVEPSPNYKVLLRTKNSGRPVLLLRKSGGQLMLLTTALYKNHFLALGLKNPKPVIGQLYASLLNYRVRKAQGQVFRPTRSFAHEGTGISLQLPAVAPGQGFLMAVTNRLKADPEKLAKSPIVCSELPCFVERSGLERGEYKSYLYQNENLTGTASFVINTAADEITEVAEPLQKEVKRIYIAGKQVSYEVIEQIEAIYRDYTAQKEKLRAPSGFSFDFYQSRAVLVVLACLLMAAWYLPVFRGLFTTRR